jgi:hypothetical protein
VPKIPAKRQPKPTPPAAVAPAPLLVGMSQRGRPLRQVRTTTLTSIDWTSPASASAFLSAVQGCAWPLHSGSAFGVQHVCSSYLTSEGQGCPANVLPLPALRLYSRSLLSALDFTGSPGMVDTCATDNSFAAAWSSMGYQVLCNVPLAARVWQSEGPSQLHAQQRAVGADFLLNAMQPSSYVTFREVSPCHVLFVRAAPVFLDATVALATQFAEHAVCALVPLTAFITNRRHCPPRSQWLARLMNDKRVLLLPLPSVHELLGDTVVENTAHAHMPWAWLVIFTDPVVAARMSRGLQPTLDSSE